MNVELVTKNDLQEFRLQLLNDLRKVLSGQPQATEKTWLKSSEVRKLLKISPNTLQTLRTTGKLHPNKVGGLLYYSQEEIYALLNSKETKH